MSFLQMSLAASVMILVILLIRTLAIHRLPKRFFLLLWVVVLLRSGDTLVVKSLDRLSRSKADIHSELQWFKENNIHLKVIDLPTTMMDLPPGQEWVFEMVNNILIEVLGTIAEQERLTIHQRQREGIDAAKSKGKHLGRPATSLPDNWEEVLALWQSGEITAREAMRRTGMKRTMFYQLAHK